MNHTIKGILIVAAITSMLVVGLSMVPIMQNSFASKKHDVKKAKLNTDINTNTNTNSADSTSSSSATAENTNNINNTATSSQSQNQSACAVAVTCPEGSTTATLGLGGGAAIANPAISSAEFVAPQSAAAQESFNTNNSGSQSATQTGTSTGGAGGSLDLCIFFCNAPGGDATVSQNVCQQIAQTGAFGASTNDITDSCSSG